ncbi:serine/threonine-protein kinase [Streptomyces albidoflavus]
MGERQALAADDPSHIGQYRLLGRLGEGGMGRVYLGRSTGGRTVALKVVQEELAQLPEFRQRFAREVAAARRVGGEWTAAVLDADTGAAVPWVATQYVLGPSLHEVVAEGYGALPEASVRVLANRLALALSAVHGAGLVHRDLKPSNVLVTVDGPRLIDFGIARALDALDPVAGDAPRTLTGMVIGSPGFMSPEQARGLELTAASDVFTLGSVLVFAMTGRQPFGGSGSGGGGLHAQLVRVAEDEPELAGVPESLLPLVRACLEKAPGLRPTPEEIAARTGGDRVGPWLPGEVLEQLGRHAAELLDFDPVPAGDREPASPVPVPSPTPTPTPTPTSTPTALDAPPPPVASAPTRTAPPRPSAPPVTPGRGRNRVLFAGAAAVAVAAVAAGLVALQPWGGGDDGTGGAVPRQFRGAWEGELTGPGDAAGGHALVEIGPGQVGSGDAKFSVLGEARLCVSGSGIEKAEHDEGSGKRVLTLGEARTESATDGEKGACRRPGRGELRFDPARNDRLTWAFDTYEVELTRREDASIERYHGATGTWYPDTGEGEPGPLEQLQVAGVSVEQNTLTFTDGMGSQPSCGYEAKVFTLKDGLLTTPPRLDDVTAGQNRDCPVTRSPLLLTLGEDDRLMTYRSLDGATSGHLTATLP